MEQCHGKVVLHKSHLRRLGVEIEQPHASSFAEENMGKGPLHRRCGGLLHPCGCNHQVAWLLSRFCASEPLSASLGSI